MRNSNWTRAYQMAPQYIPNSLAEKPVETRSSLGPVPREMANVETEGGETVFLPNKDGLPAHYKIHGPRHHEGGVPMNIPPDSFVFSDTASMRIKDKELQKEFGMPESKKGYTPAEIAKRYDINKYRKVLQDPNSDRLQIETAEKVIANFQVKLGKLALVQESAKGFPDGIPIIALPFLAKYNLSPEMILPTQLDTAQQPAQQEMFPEEMPVARYGGMPFYQAGGTTGVSIDPEAEQQLNFLPNFRRNQRLQKRAQREAERNYMLNFYTNLLQDVVSEDSIPFDNGDPTTGVFLRTDEKGNPYYVDGKGIRIKTFDDTYYGKNNAPTSGNERIIERNGKRYRVTTKTVTKSSVDKSKIIPKSEANSPGEVYEENGKYYQIQKYDRTKPINSTTSGERILQGDPLENKTKAIEILKKLEGAGAAVYHSEPYTVGGKQKNPGWEIKASAKGKLTTAEKEYLTDYFSISTQQGVLGAGENDVNVSLQGSDNSGFYGYTNPDFYEYRFWKAQNADRSPEDWDKLDAAGKTANRKLYFRSLGFDLSDDHINANIDNPAKLYTNDFVSGRKQARLAEEIPDSSGTKHTALGFTDAVEAFFDDQKANWRPAFGADKKLGLEHADAYSFEKTVKEIDLEGEEVTEEKEEEIMDTKSPNHITDRKYSPWWIQDIVNISGAAQDLFSIKKYKPYKATYAPYVPQPTFYDPSREIAAIQETAGMAGDLIQGLGTSAQSMGARLAQIQGTAAESIANTMGKYNNLNVGTANEFAYKKADIVNDAQLKNQVFTKQYIDEFNTLNQNYDNARRAARETLRNSYTQGITNKAQAQVLNTLYPNYQIDPMRGGMLSFYKGTDITAGEEEATNAARANEFVSWWQQSGIPKAGDAWDIYSGQGSSKRKKSSPQQDYFEAYQNAYQTGPAAPNVYSQNAYRQKGGMIYPFAYTTGYFK